jgi:hypothetical protein
MPALNLGADQVAFGVCTHPARGSASWGAALRSRAAGSQDELRCSAIHKQRPYRVFKGGETLAALSGFESSK